MQWASVIGRTAILPCDRGQEVIHTGIARRFCRARRARARQPRTTFFALFPLPLKKAGASVIGRTAILPCEARPRAPATHYILLPSPSSLEKSCVLPLSAAGGRAGRGQGGFHTGIARRFCRARRAHARQPRTTFYILLPILYYADGICGMRLRFWRYQWRDRPVLYRWRRVRGVPGLP